MCRLLIVIFRGGWIDTITSCEAEDAEDIINWFRSSGYVEEIRGFATGEGLSALQGVSELEDWLAKHGIERAELSARNLKQVSVIMEGLKEYHRSKSGYAVTDTQKY